jgi:four helix bundle protein
MTEKTKNKTIFDLDERTLIFAGKIRSFIKTLPHTITNNEDCKQLVRSSGSVGANYIEANEALSKKDFLMRLKICRKEAKESAYWLKLIQQSNHLGNSTEMINLINEVEELKKIFSSIIEKTEIKARLKE